MYILLCKLTVLIQAYRDSPVQTILIIQFTSERSERKNFLGCTGILANVQGKRELCIGILLK